MKPPDKSSLSPIREQERLAALGRYAILDTPAEDKFDRITALAATICEAPNAFVSFIDAERQWFKSQYGSSINTSDRRLSFCQYTILSTEGFEVEDASRDPRFKTNPLVADTPHIRFYSGQPLTTPDGYNLGSLCVTDYVPRTLSKAQSTALQTLAKEIVAELELRLRNRQLEELNSELQAANAKISAYASQQQKTQEELRMGLADLELQRKRLAQYGDRMRLLHRIATDEHPCFQTKLKIGLQKLLAALSLDCAVIASFTSDVQIEHFICRTGVDSPAADHAAVVLLLEELAREHFPTLTEVSLSQSLLAKRSKKFDPLNSCLGTVVHPQDSDPRYLLFFSTHEHREEFTDGDLDFLNAISRWVARLVERISVHTELEVLNQELIRSNTELDDFAKAASHDLRAPLRAVRNLADWIQEDAAQHLPEASKENLDLLKQRVERMDDLLVDLLEYATAGITEDQIHDIDMHILLEDVLRLISIPKGFHIDIAELPQISTFKTPLEKIFRNLIYNALSHHDASSGTIWISGKELGDGLVEYCVRDDGPGIALADQERIFTMFTTLSPKSQSASSGIGLSLVRRSLKVIGGTVRVESVGRGSSFYLTLPKTLRLRTVG